MTRQRARDVAYLSFAAAILIGTAIYGCTASTAPTHVVERAVVAH